MQNVECTMHNSQSSILNSYETTPYYIINADGPCSCCDGSGDNTSYR